MTFSISSLEYSSGKYLLILSALIITFRSFCFDSARISLTIGKVNSLFFPYSFNLDDCDVETQVLSAITMESVYAKADELVHYGALILRLRCEENCSNREIAKRIGLARQVVDCKMNVMLKFFRKNINIFF